MEQEGRGKKWERSRGGVKERRRMREKRGGGMVREGEKMDVAASISS